MSRFNDIDYDEDEIYDENYYDDEDIEEDDENYDDEDSNVVEESEEEIKQTIHSINILTLSDKKKNQKKTSSGFTGKKSKKGETTNQIVYVDSVEFGENNCTESKITQPSKQEFCQNVNFALNILQSSKMYYEDVGITQLIQVSGNPKYVAQVQHLHYNAWRLVNTLKKYKTQTEAYEKELTEKDRIIQQVSPNKVSGMVQQLFNRVDHLSCLSSSGSSLFVYGGRKGSNPLDDLIHYQFSTGKIVVYKSLQYITEQSITLKPIIPPISNSAMMEHSDNLYIFGKSKKGGTLLYVLEGVSNHEKIRISASTSIDIPHRNSFSFCKLDGNLEHYMFGGKSSQILDDLYRIQYSYGRFEVVPLIKGASPMWPSSRYAHNACTVANLMFIYGGLGANEQPMNDLYMYDTTSGIWTEIVVDSMLPPPLFKHQLFSVNTQSIFLHGGLLDNLPTFSNSLFRFDIVDKKWNMIEVLADEQNMTFSGHQCHVVAGKVLMIGTVPEKKSTNTKKGAKKLKEPSPIVRLLNSNDPGKSVQICSYLDGRRQEGYLCDVVFKVRDEGTSSFSYFLAHKCIIKARCENLHSKIIDSCERIGTHGLSGIFNEDEISLVEICETSTDVFEQYLRFLYTGSIQLSTGEDVKGMVGFVNKLSPKKHFPLIEKICSLTTLKDLDLNKQILAQIHEDFLTLVSDHQYCDLNIVLNGDDNLQNEDVDGIPVHKLIMSRSAFFSRMLVTSGMSETKEKTVYLTDYSKEVMLDLLKYLYTDLIQLTPSNCIGIMIYSMMFDLLDLAGCCRRMVVTLLDNTTVWSVHEVALLYNEKSLESECERYIANNYSSLYLNSNFLNMPETARINVKTIYERKNKK